MEDQDIVISKVLPGCSFAKAEPDLSYDSTSPSTVPNQWKVVPTNPLSVYVDESIDLSGYNMQEMTFFPELAFYQVPPTGTMLGSDGGTIIDCLVVSTVPLDMDGLNSQLITGSAPALSDISLITNPTATEWETIPYCRIATYARNDNTPSGTGLLQPIDISQIGSLQPTAVDKLFIYRMLIPYSNTAPYNVFSLLSGASCRVGFRGMTKQEPEIEYLMRLKRGYELANQVGQA